MIAQFSTFLELLSLALDSTAFLTGTQQWNSIKQKNLLHVQQRLGHKNIRNTTIYTHLITTEGDEYHSTTAKTAKEVCKLVDAGLECVCDVDDLKIFKKENRL